MWPYPWTHVGTPSHLGHMDWMAATMPSQARAGAAQEAPDIGQWEGQDVSLVRPFSCNVKGGIPSSRRYLPTYLSILRRRPVVQELISRAHIHDVCQGTNTQDHHPIPLGKFFAVCKDNQTRLKLGKCEFMQEIMQYLGFNIGYGWRTPAVPKAKPLMDAKVRLAVPKKRLHEIRSFIGACRFCRCHIKILTFINAILTDPSRRALPRAGALKSTKSLTSSRTTWLTQNPWACLRHEAKFSWSLTTAMWAEVEHCSSGKR